MGDPSDCFPSTFLNSPQTTFPHLLSLSSASALLHVADFQKLCDLTIFYFSQFYGVGVKGEGNRRVGLLVLPRLTHAAVFN